jgi:type I restriction enzyme, S subunit
VNLQTFDDNFELLAEAPNGVRKLRELILQLAMQGKLVPQDPHDEPADELLAAILTRKQQRAHEEQGKRVQTVQPISPDEVPYKLPRGWVWERLGNIGDTNIGLTYSPRDIGRNGVPVLRSNNIQNGKIDLSNLIRVSVDPKRSVLVEVGDLLICARNGSRALVGKAALIGYLPEKTAFGAFMAIFRSSMNQYLYYFIRSPLFRLMIDDVNTTTINQITQANLRSTIAPVPPLAEQKRIVAKVDRMMELCDELESRQQNKREARVRLNQSTLDHVLAASTAEEFNAQWQRICDNFDLLYDATETIGKLRQSILQLAVQGKLVPQDPTDEPASTLLERVRAEKENLYLKTKSKQFEPLPSIKANEKEEIAKGWEWERLGNLARFVDYRGNTPPKTSNGVKLITAKNVRMGFINDEPKEYISEETYTKWMTRGFPKPGDLLFTTEAPLGNIAVLCTDEKIALAQRVIDLQPFSDLYSPYLKVCLMSSLMQKRILDKATGMTAKGIKASKLKLILLPIPPLKEQKRIVAKVDQTMKLCDELEAKLTHAQSISENLMASIVNHLSTTQENETVHLALTI